MRSTPDAARMIESLGLCGDDLVTFRIPDVRCGQRVALRLRETDEWLEVVAGIDSVVVQFDAARMSAEAALRRVAAALESPALHPAMDSPVCMEIPVHYGGEQGPDLDRVCERLGLSPPEFVTAHVGADWQVDMLGFMPGFAYLSSSRAVADVPRLDEPRLHVPAGSVGVAERRTGLYALPGPGGWSIVGRTPARLFDAAASPPFRLAAGMRVRFRAIEAGDGGRS